MTGRAVTSPAISPSSSSSSSSSSLPPPSASLSHPPSFRHFTAEWLVLLIMMLTAPLTHGNYAGVMSCGYYHTCGITSTGDATCWGDNKSNQSRIPKEYARFQILTDHEATNGTWSILFDWARDHNGMVFNLSDPKLGFTVHGNITFRNITSWRSISAGFTHTCGLTGDGHVLCWGQGRNRQALLPQWVMGATPEWRHVSAGTGHTCGVLLNGSAACWGANDEGQCDVPQNVDGWLQVDAGYAHTCGVTLNGSAVCWGWNGVASGNMVPFGQATPPHTVQSWKSISAGFVHSCGVSSNGTGYCWGKNDNRQTNVPSVIELPVPDHIQQSARRSSAEAPYTSIAMLKWQYIDASYFHSCGLTVNGTVLCWGNNDAGQSRVPDHLTMVAGSDIVLVSAGFVHNCVLNSSGYTYCWGPTPHGPKNFWFLGQVQPPNMTMLTPAGTSGDFLSRR